jgi:periplasmic protein CpxP/Spy
VSIHGNQTGSEAGWTEEKFAMNIRSSSLVLGVLFCTGLLMAQAPDQSQSQVGIAPQAAQNAQQQDQQQAQQPDQQQHQVDPARAARRLGKQLGLTQDQVDQIRPIIADRQQQIESIRSDSTLMPRDRRMKMRNVMQDSRNKIEALLTDPQKQQFEQMQQNRREHREQPQAQ